MRDFVGTERFEVISRLGSGGMGAVYHVLDRERRARMALKTVGIVDGDALLRFKREYRSLQDLDHPNLIQLGELFEASGEWFYTMELIDGTTFLRWVRPNAPTRSAEEIAAEATRAGEGAGSPTDRTDVAAPDDDPTSTAQSHPRVAFDEIRLRRSLAQLASGLAALHAAGKVHRDIKPSNVLVSTNGRVVLLDFGLVTDVRRGEQKSDVGIMGTYAYMAPEQAAGRAVGPASDWYAVGVMLFQALTGQLPFRGTTDALIFAKLHETAPEARMLFAGAPQDLNDLARDLLARDPEARPSDREILERLHVEGGHDLGGFSSPSSGAEGRTFVGRTAELAELRQAFDSLLQQEPSAIVVAGESGIGKSELVRRFLDHVEDRHPNAIVLAGRCFERESVPFRSFDGVVDCLSSELAGLTRDRVEWLVPRHRELVARVFPVLRRVEGMRDDDEPEIPDPQEKRARLFGAMRALLVKLAASDPLVLVVEDLQWIDDDSRMLLEEILREPGAPTLMLVTTQRTAAGEEHAVLDAPVLRTSRARVLPVASLSDADAVALAERLLRDASGDRRASIDAIVRESRGHPLFVDQLAHHVASHRSTDGGVGRLEDAIQLRIASLGEDAVAALRATCVSGAPIPIGDVAAATGLELDVAETCLRELRKQRLVRCNGFHANDQVEPFHARISEIVMRAVEPDEVRALHGTLARALEGRASADPVDLARHFAGAGEVAIAARHAVAAARRASEMLAFDRAAELYRRSLELAPAPDPDLGDRPVLLARALANAGRGKDAAAAYLVAAEGRPDEQSTELRRRAAEQFLLSGHVSLGMASLRDLLLQIGMRFPDTTFRAVLSILWVRTWLLFRNHRFVERAPTDVAPIERFRLETCHSAALGLTATDTIRGLDFYGRSYRLALELGDRSKIAQLLATEAINHIASNGRGQRKAFKTVRRARALAESTGDPHARGVVIYAEGMGRYLLGQWREGADGFLEADRTFREECSESPPEFRTLQACVIHSLYELGDYRALQQRASRALKESEERGDIFTEATIRSGLAMQMHCMLDDAQAGYDAATKTIDAWTGSTFDVQRYMYLVHSAFALLYLDRLDEARERMDRCVNQSRTSMLLWVQLMRAGAFQARALVTLAKAAADPSQRRSLVRAALADARRMAREDSLWAKAGAAVIRGNACALLGDRDEAIAWLDEGARGCEQAKMIGRSEAARWAMGRIVGGSSGKAMIEAARTSFAERGVRRPDRFVRGFAPVLFLPGGDEPWA